MDEARERLLNSSRRAAMRELQASFTGAQTQLRQASGNSRAYLLASSEIQAGFARACEAGANRIAEVASAKSPEYAVDLRAVLEDLAANAVREMRALSPGMRERSAPLFGKLADELSEQLRAEINATIEDLSIGIAGGTHVDRTKSRMISIDNRQGSGQFAIDSAGASQHVGRDISSASTQRPDPAVILQLMQEARFALTSSDLPLSDADAISDQILNVERELNSEQPDTSRVRRLLGWFAGFTEKVAASALGGIFAKVAALAAEIPRS